jgi:hypothetical protein
MATFDFNSLNRPASAKRPTNPIEIFRGAPALAETPNDLWQGQSKALELWYNNRHQRDTLISLHTGAGKSIVGLLIAQSLINEGVSKVLYVCATNDLVSQTSREIATKLGFNATSARDALASVVDKVVVADRRLSGWYNIQLGHTFELQGDIETAAKQYSQARGRIYSLLALPYPATTSSVTTATVPVNKLHSRLMETFASDVRHQNDQIAKIERTVGPLFDPSASASQHEEAMRSLGDVLGVTATRPEQDDDNACTLDVLWRNETKKESILIELKTKKKPEGMIGIDDVGQGFNHMEWVTSTFPEEQVLGLIIVSLSQKRSAETSPSKDMWLANLAPFRELFDEFLQSLAALQRLTPLQRVPEMEAFALRAEWQPETIFLRLRGIQMLSVPSQ